MLDLTHELREIAGALDAAGAVYALAGGLAVPTSRLSGRIRHDRR